MRNEQDEDGEVTRVPVEGVKLDVADAGGAEVGTATTDADGHFELALPGPGDYTVRLDQSTLPDGVELRDEAQAEVRSSTSGPTSARSSTTSSVSRRARPRAGWTSSRRRSPTASSSA